METFETNSCDPQVVWNDVLNGSLSLNKCSLLILDEAHHSTGKHAMAQSAEMYNSASEKLIFGTTAELKPVVINEICKRLEIERIHIRKAEEPMLRDYISGLEIEKILQMS